MTFYLGVTQLAGARHFHKALHLNQRHFNPILNQTECCKCLAPKLGSTNCVSPITNQKDEKFIARVRQWSEIVVEGETEERVLAQAQSDLKALLNEGRRVQLDLEVEPDEHPWQKFAGMFADDPDWEAFQTSMQQYRQEIDQALLED